MLSLDSSGNFYAGRVRTIKWSSNLCIENSKNRTTFRVPLNELVAQPTSVNFSDSKVISSNQVNKHTDTMPFDTLRIDSFGSVGDLESDWLRHTFPILSTLCDCVWTLKVWSQWPDFFATKNQTKIKSLKEWIGNAHFFDIPVCCWVYTVRARKGQDAGYWKTADGYWIERESFKST